MIVDNAKLVFSTKSNFQPLCLVTIRSLHTCFFKSTLDSLSNMSCVRVDLEPGTLVALYNGVKRGPYAEVSPESWDTCGYSIGYYESTTAERGEQTIQDLL